MESPYFNCKMFASVGLFPHQFDSNYALHIKNNLIKRLEKKCNKDYGYIVKIFGILELNDGLVHGDNPMAVAMFNVAFSCKLCKPINNSIIVCQIKQITRELMSANNGPIVIFIQPEDINQKNFSIDSNGNIKYKKNKIDNVLTKNTFVLVKIMQNVFYDSDNAITALGRLEDIANDEQIKMFYEDLYKDIGGDVNQNESQLDEL